MIVDALAGLAGGFIVVGCAVAGYIRVQKYIKDSIATALGSRPSPVNYPSISPAEAEELRNRVRLLDLKIEGQIKPQIEIHHAAIRAVDENMRNMIDAVK